MSKSYMTPKTLDTLEAIHFYPYNNAFSPTLTDIAKSMRVTIPTVQYHVAKLRDIGYVKKAPKHKSRTLAVTTKGKSYLHNLLTISADGSEELAPTNLITIGDRNE